MWSFIAALFASIGWGGSSLYKKGSKELEDKARLKATKTNPSLQNHYLEQADYIVWTAAIELSNKGMSGEEIKTSLFDRYNIRRPEKIDFSIPSKNAEWFDSIDGLAFSLMQRQMKELGYQYYFKGYTSKIFALPYDLQERIQETKFKYGWE